MTHHNRNEPFYRSTAQKEAGGKLARAGTSAPKNEMECSHYERRME